MILINVDAAKKAVHEEFDECLVWDESGKHTANVIEGILEALPTVDAVPVIRCKDCLYWGEDGYHNGCKYANCIMEENDYCSMAERRADEQNRIRF